MVKCRAVSKLGERDREENERRKKKAAAGSRARGDKAGLLSASSAPIPPLSVTTWPIPGHGRVSAGAGPGGSEIGSEYTDTVLFASGTPTRLNRLSLRKQCHTFPKSPNRLIFLQFLPHVAVIPLLEIFMRSLCTLRRPAEGGSSALPTSDQGSS